jgi:tetratricopeptide (TPR) repeat protein
VISANDQHLLRKITSKKRKDPVAYSLVTRNYVNGLDCLKWSPNEGLNEEEKGSGWFPSEKVRLFRRDPRFHFENTVHEMVEPTILLNKIPILKCSVLIHHFGKLDEEKTLQKGNEYFALGKKKLDEEGSNLQNLKELAVQAGNLGRFEEAVDLWTRVIDLHPQFTEAYINLSSIYMKLKMYQKAAEASHRASTADPSNKEALINFSLASYFLGNLDQAISCLEGITLNGSPHPLALGLLCLSYILKGEKEKSRPLVHKLMASGFDFRKYLNDSAQELFDIGREGAGKILLQVAIEGLISGKDNSEVSLLQISRAAETHEEGCSIFRETLV